MRTIDIESLRKTRDRALKKYEAAKKNLQTPQSPEMLTALAQEANDAWLEFKKIDVDFKNSSILKTMGDLYGC